MLPISCTKDGITITISAITKNKEYVCKDCWNTDDCSLKAKCMLKPLKAKLIATELVASVINATEDTFSIQPGNWELVDSDGFSYGGESLCDKHIPPRTVNPSSWSVSPGTRVKFLLVFPEMDNSMDVIAIIYGGRPFIRLDVKTIPSNVAEMFKLQEEASIKKSLEQDYKFKRIHDDLQNLKKNIFARFHNTLTPKEQTSLDNSIVNLEFTINEYLQKAPSWQIDMIKPDFDTAMNDYHSNISIYKEREQKIKKYPKK